MRKFHICKPDRSIENSLRDKIDNLTKPKGSLGRLEDLALQIGLIQQSLTPVLKNPYNILFGADHGITEENVTVSPKKVTLQQMLHFSRGGAGINFLCNQHGFKLLLVDAGVDGDFPAESGIIDMKIRRGTRNFSKESAMTPEEAEEAINRGAAAVDIVYEEGCNVVSFGEMGSGNTSCASAWMHILTGMPVNTCVGAGAGLDTPGIVHKADVIRKAIDNYKGSDDLLERLAWFGGYELMMALGGMLRAAEYGMIIIVDGFIMTACMAAAMAFYPDITDYAVFGHCGDESGHKAFLDYLGAKPLLQLSLRLGEGSGAVCAYPILQSAVRMICEMDSFNDADVLKYFK